MQDNGETRALGFMSTQMVQKYVQECIYYISRSQESFTQDLRKILNDTLEWKENQSPSQQQISQLAFSSLEITNCCRFSSCLLLVINHKEIGHPKIQPCACGTTMSQPKRSLHMKIIHQIVLVQFSECMLMTLVMLQVFLNIAVYITLFTECATVSQQILLTTRSVQAESLNI